MNLKALRSSPPKPLTMQSENWHVKRDDQKYQRPIEEKGTREIRVEQAGCLKGTTIAVRRAGKRGQGKKTGCLKKAKPIVSDTETS